MILTNSDSTLNIPKDFHLYLFPPLDMMYVDDAPNILNVPDVCHVIDVPDVTEVIEVTSILDITDVPDVPDVTNVSDDLCDLRSTSDISQVTTTGEVLKVHHNVDMSYDANVPVLLSSSSSPFPCRPPYPNQWCNINLHGTISAYDFLQAHVHTVETVPDDATTYNPPVDEFNTVKGSCATPLPPGNTCRELSKYS
jgi:hypothetical protein